jgi:diacylglycerol kinase (ATP)
VKTTVIWNTGAGSAEAAAAAKDELRQAAGISLVEVATRGETIQAARQASDGGAELVVAAGGDGTVNAVVNGLMAAASRPALGVLPTGTANDFARSLAMPLEVLEAVRCLRDAAYRRIDTVETVSEGASHYFINMATAGNSERVIEQVTPEQKDFWGPLVYVREAVDVALDLESYQVAVQLDDGPTRTYSAWNVILANGRTSAGGLEIAPRANLEDGLLDVIVVTDGRFPDLFEIGAKLWMHRFLESEHVDFHRARKVRVTSNPPLHFTADGDLIEWVPAEFKVHAGALEVVVGPEYST